jgi:16S rRNA (uracil1498-N3)-methyltransferase
LRIGDAFEAFDPQARRKAMGRIFALGPPAQAVFDAPRTVSAHVQIHWVHAWPKGDKADAIVRDATELGATSIRFVDSKRAVPKLDAKKAAIKLERFRRIAEEAARQSGRSDVPTVEVGQTLDGCLAELEGVECKFFLSPRATLPLGNEWQGLEVTEAFAFVTGPEGGWDPEEERLAESSGYVLASLGAGVLRTETVPAAVLGALQITLGASK